MGRKHFVFAEPRDACEDLTNKDKQRKIEESAFSGQIAHATAVSGIVIINNEPGLEHLPGPDAHDIPFSVVSVGQQIESTVWRHITMMGAKNESAGFGRVLNDYVIPINCENSCVNCVQATHKERAWVCELA